MKKTIVVTSLFAVCLLIALPLTSVAESTEKIDKAYKSKDIVINRVSGLRDSIKERLSGSRTLGIGCLLWLVAAFLGVILMMLGL